MHICMYRYVRVHRHFFSNCPIIEHNIEATLRKTVANQKKNVSLKKTVYRHQLSQEYAAVDKNMRNVEDIEVRNRTIFEMPIQTS